MEPLLWILFIALGGTLYACFGQHRNKLKFQVEEVTQEDDYASTEGLVHEGWIGLSQHVYFLKETGIGSAHVIAILSGEKQLRLARKGERVRLVIRGSELSNIISGSILSTTKEMCSYRNEK